jgi:hypothetical protein
MDARECVIGHSYRADQLRRAYFGSNTGCGVAIFDLPWILRRLRLL